MYSDSDPEIPPPPPPADLPPPESYDSDDEQEAGPSSPLQSRYGRRRQMPARFQQNDSDSDQNDGILCAICQKNEPESLTANMVFRVDCSECDCWVHNFCASGNNTASRKYKCSK